MHKIFHPPISPEALQRMSFEEKYEGFCVDLVKVCQEMINLSCESEDLVLQELSKEVKFKYEFYMVEGGGYGALKNGRWTGMIADLRSQKADMAVIDMSITSIRQTAVDFTMPYMTTGDLLRWGKLIFTSFYQAWEFYTRKSFLLHPILSPSCSRSPSRCGSTRRPPTSGCPSPCSSWPGLLRTSGRTMGRARPPTSGPSLMLSGLVSGPFSVRAATFYRGY